MTEPLLYETAEPGEAVGPFSYVIPGDHNRQRLAAYGLDESAFLPGSGFAEPSLLCGQHSWVMRQRYSWGGSVHAKCDIAYLKPVRLGARIHVTCRISGKYERRGGRYVVFRLETTDDSGALACTVENSMLLNFREVIAARRAAKAQPASTPATSGGPALALSFGPKPLGRDDILGFFAAEEAVYGPHASLHNRDDIARAAGLADIIAPGRYSIGLMNCMFARLYGERWLSGGRYSVTFLQNLLPGLVLQVKAGPAPGNATSGPRFDVASMDTVAGRPVLSGTASLTTDG